MKRVCSPGDVGPDRLAGCRLGLQRPVRPPPGLRGLRVFGLCAGLAILAPAHAQARQAAAGCSVLPFGQQLDVTLVRALAHVPPSDLLARIAALGIDVRRVPSAGPDRPPNPLLAPLPAASAALIAKAGFSDGMQGRAIPRHADCCGLARDTVLIRDVAIPYTLLHEVAHLLIQPVGRPPAVDVEQQFALAYHRLTVYQRRLYDDPTRLLDPHWRRDILGAQQAVAGLLHDRIRIGQSQEAIIEQVLGSCIDETSPYRDAARRAEGWRYGLAMVDNAVDAFNAVHASIEFCDDTVRRLLDDLNSGRLALPVGGALDVTEVAAFSAAASVLRQTLAGTRQDIESLKRFYAPLP
jgi:hypothetical protein